MKRKNKSYKKPMKAFQAGRIKSENELKKKYALKNKQEIWKTQAKVDYYRGRAKALASRPHEEQEVLFKKLRALGLKVDVIADVLDLKVEDVLKRRLPTVVAGKKLANTVQQARQMVVHKKIKIGGKVVSAPSYLVPVSEENKIEVKKKVRKPKPAPVEEKPAEEAVPVENAETSGEPKEAEKEEVVKEESVQEEKKEESE
jgi:small subunit ribosomal protein S4